MNMDKTNPANWTEDDMAKIYEVMETLQLYDFDTTSTTIDLTDKIPDHIESE
jgi:hypothetical protein